MLYLGCSCLNPSLGIFLEFLWFSENFSCLLPISRFSRIVSGIKKTNSKKTYPNPSSRALGLDPPAPAPPAATQPQARSGPIWARPSPRRLGHAAAPIDGRAKHARCGALPYKGGHASPCAPPPEDRAAGRPAPSPDQDKPRAAGLCAPSPIRRLGASRGEPTTPGAPSCRDQPVPPLPVAGNLPYRRRRVKVEPAAWPTAASGIPAVSLCLRRWWATARGLLLLLYFLHPPIEPQATQSLAPPPWAAGLPYPWPARSPEEGEGRFAHDPLWLVVIRIFVLCVSTNLQITPSKNSTFTHKTHPHPFIDLTLSFVLFASTIQCVLQIFSATPWDL
jgi:hypothetical protein